jgi:hypothetical protein
VLSISIEVDKLLFPPSPLITSIERKTLGRLLSDAVNNVKKVSFIIVVIRPRPSDYLHRARRRPVAESFEILSARRNVVYNILAL